MTLDDFERFVLICTCLRSPPQIASRAGGAENARLENAGLEVLAPCYRGWKMRDWNNRHQTAGVENEGLENSGTGKVWNATCGRT